MVRGADMKRISARQERMILIEEILSSTDSRLDDRITGYVYSDWTTVFDTNYCFYVGKGNRRRLERLSRNKYHDSIMKKYGINRIVECELFSERELLLQEIKLIELYGTYNFENFRGSNFTVGGEGCRGYRFTSLQREKITGSGNPMFGRHYFHTEESKLKISGTKFEQHPTRKTIEQLTLDGEVVATYTSAREIERIFNYNHSSISKCCLGHQLTAYGFRWRFFEKI